MKNEFNDPTFKINIDINTGIADWINPYTGEEKKCFFWVCSYHGCTIDFHESKGRDFGCYYDDSPNPTFNNFHGDAERENLEKLSAYLDIENDIIYSHDIDCSELDYKKFIHDERVFSLLPIDPRDALFGGRTEVFCNYVRATEEAQIKYVDYNSLKKRIIILWVIMKSSEIKIECAHSLNQANSLVY